MNYDNYKALAQEWDNFETFDLFTQITQNDDRLHYVTRRCQAQ
ncbi:MAG: hypothetical protein ACLR8N_06615 [Lachnospiraceae bacterium]